MICILHGMDEYEYVFQSTTTIRSMDTLYVIPTF